ncbi:MAG TPA: flavodoxin domain-containing protein [Candidatus Acidoferrales bacterium]|nr:flavodoxin domain-containing protein [Candidatus Acidoferrales bacterium]
MKVYVVYDSQYGNTKAAAEKIVEGISKVEGFETAIGYVKEVDLGKLAEYDAIILGAPNHMGRPSRTIKRFIDRLSKGNLKANAVAVFGTYSGRLREPDRSVKKLEQIVGKKLPRLKLLLPGLSIRVIGIPGPIAEGELPRCVEFGEKIARQLGAK